MFVCIRKLFQSFPSWKQEQHSQKLLFSGFCSIYSTLSGIWEQKYPAQRLTIHTKQCNQMSFPLLVALLLQLATSIAVSCIAFSLQRSLCLYHEAPQTCLQNVLFVSSIALFRALFSSVWRFQKKKKKGYIWDNRVQKGDVYTAHWSQYQALYTHCTLSQNTVMLEIRMAFHANRGTCCAGDRLVLQTELKWKTNPTAILNKTPLGNVFLCQTKERNACHVTNVQC